MTRRIEGVRALSASTGDTLVAIGNFDGVHRGHQAVIRSSLELAHERHLTPLVLTFHPHPLDILGGHPRRVLTPIDRKLELLTTLDSTLMVVVEPFTRELGALHPDAFVKSILVDALHAKVVIVGRNFRFGQGRSGDLESLKSLGEPWGLEAQAVALVGDDLGGYSSTRIREFVGTGAVEQAAQLLGRPHALTGTVVEGNRQGRKLGFPTANLEGIEEALPAQGVYAGWVDLIGPSGQARPLARAMANFGVRPTLNAGPSVEAHLLDFTGDLYGKRLRLHLVKHLRPEQRFPSLGDLVAQLHRDREETAQCILPATVNSLLVPPPRAN